MNQSKTASYTRLGDTLIEISTQTPNGPWEEMGMWDRNQSGENNTSTYTLDKPTWVRYLKFTSKVKERSVYTLPETLKVFEEKPSDTYQSIQGEWGMDSHDAFYETLMEKNKKHLLSSGRK
ncbi:MAG: hypothetical protein Q9M36_06470 [Sulfurovum sp.]|nr:hypothetical protein [Sulfurovum sp.]